MSEKSVPTPFKTLGSHLKYLREQSNESLAEVSGAVEIDSEFLEQIEAGIERPAEDILLLLITHFAMPDQEAVQLWELAGYDGGVPDQIRPDDPRLMIGGRNTVMLLALDMRTAYTDGVDIIPNRAGLTVSFTQMNIQGQTAPVARLGMSIEQAEEVIAALQRGVLRARHMDDPKGLPPASNQ